MQTPARMLIPAGAVVGDYAQSQTTNPEPCQAFQ